MVHVIYNWEQDRIEVSDVMCSVRIAMHVEKKHHEINRSLSPEILLLCCYVFTHSLNCSHPPTNTLTHIHCMYMSYVYVARVNLIRVAFLLCGTYSTCTSVMLRNVNLLH